MRRSHLREEKKKEWQRRGLAALFLSSSRSAEPARQCIIAYKRTMRFLFFSCRGESDIDFRSSVPVCVYMHKRIVRNNNNNSNTPPLVFFCVSCIDTGLTFFVFGAIFFFSNAQLIDGRLVCVRLHCASVSRCCLALACRAGPSYRLFPSPNTL